MKINKNKNKILIIEDETMLQDVLAEYLEGENFGVLKAQNGEKGLKITISQKPDLIILDIILPKMNGFEFLNKIRIIDEFKDIPIIVLTNLESTEDIQKAFDKGVENYLVKSNYKMEDILKKIKEIFNKK